MVLRALALLQLAKGVSVPRISVTIPLTPQAIRKVRWGIVIRKVGWNGHLMRGNGPVRAEVGRQPETAADCHGLQ